MRAKFQKSITDNDGNSYKTVQIGPQIWMAENLNVAQYQNGDPISNLINDVDWKDFESGAMCDYDNDPENSNIYGKLYNWYAVTDERKIAPLGWHVPSDAEWNLLLEYLEEEIDPETSPNDRKNYLLESLLTESSLNNGFNALPGGCRRIFDPNENEIFPYRPNRKLKFVGIGDVCCWWTSSEETDFQHKYALYRAIGEDIWYHGVKGTFNREKWSGLSVRCVMDSMELTRQNLLEASDINSSLKPEFVSDIDGNVYKTVLIGSQVWMAENLKVTHYQNGDPINTPKDSIIGKRNLSGAYCLNYKNIGSNGDTYGKLYSWKAINDKRKITPNGWHIPSNFEWKILFFFLGGFKNAGGKMKEIGFTHWSEPNAGATNDFGFTALPAGEYRSDYGFSNIGWEGKWWSLTETISKIDPSHTNPNHRHHYGNCYFLSHNNSEVKHIFGRVNDAHSVRCVKDFSVIWFLTYLIQSIAKIFSPLFFTKNSLLFKKPEIEWVTIPAGTFTIESAVSGEKEVTMQSFRMSKYAITFEQYDIFCDAMKRNRPSNPYWGGRGNLPAVGVKWKDALAFANWLGCRLPTSFEWEYACRAGSKTKFYTGNNLLPTQANIYIDGDKQITALPVGTFDPNMWGLYDMLGNVSEWCSESFDFLNPHYPTKFKDSNLHHAMGGSFLSTESQCAKLTYTLCEEGKYRTVGFRIVSKE